MSWLLALGVLSDACWLRDGHRSSTARHACSPALVLSLPAAFLRRCSSSNFHPGSGAGEPGQSSLQSSPG